jgi:serine/threonine protein kinase
MIDEFGNARITDFGLAKIIRGSDSLASTSEGHGPTLRWTAPEIFEFGNMVSEESDVYSFSMVTIEVGE